MKKSLHLLGKMGKYYLYGMLMQVMFMNFILASDINAQGSHDIKEVKVSLNLESASLPEVFETLKNKTGFYFIYDKEVTFFDDPVDINASEESLESVLLFLAADFNLSFRQVNDRISVKLNPNRKNQKNDIIIDVTVSGVVLDSSGTPLPGVTILVENTNIGTVTDIDGRYSLEAPENSVLLFSFVGFQSQRIRVGTSNTIDVTLVEDESSLEEVVVVGYGSQRRRDLTGSISSVKLDDVVNLAVASPDAMLQGKAAGVQVIQNSGTPGAEVFVRVRGSASLLADSRPLYVIDGIPMTNIGRQGLDGGGHRPSALADINPNDIESIEVLKDAASAAIYGSRGAAGVVLITTKKGKSGEAKINFNAYTGIQQVWRKLDLLEGDEMVDLVQEMRANRGLAPDPALVRTGLNTHWQDEIFQNAITSNYNLSLAGGNDRMTSFVSLSYFDQDGTIRGQEFERFSGRLNLEYQATDFLKIGTSTTYSHTNRRRVANDFSGYSALGNALIANPNFPVRDDEGNWSLDPIGVFENPVMITEDLLHYGVQKRLISNMFAEIKFHDKLRLRSTFGIDNLSSREERFIPSYFTGVQGRAHASAESFEETVWQNENILTYTENIGEHSINLMAGTTLLESRSDFLFAGGREAASDIIRTLAIADPFIPGHSISNWGLSSFFARANYAYGEKYLAEVSVRRDGSSRFGRDRRYGVFPALSLGWRITEEDFLPTTDFLNDLKLRASIGMTGNQEGISNFGSLALYGTGRNYNAIPGITQTSLANVELGWESTVQTNIGLDVSLFNHKIDVFIDAYDRVTRDLLFERQLPWVSGFSGISRANLGSMRNRGLELMISSRNIESGRFSWTTDFNISWNRNKILDLPDSGGELGSDMIFTMPSSMSVEGPANIYRVGESIGSFWGYNYLGVFPTDEDVPELLFNRGVRGGDFIFEDVNEDGIYSRAYDQMIIGNAIPLHTGGITNNFRYGRFDMSILFNWSYGNDIYNMTRAVLEGMAREGNQLTTVRERWQNPGDVTDMPRPLYGTSSVSGASATDRSNRFIEDGSFLRMRNLTIGYNLPTSLLEKVKLANGRVYISGQNLITITNYTGMDPENQNIGNNITMPTLGVDYLTQPQPRVYMVGVNVGF